LPASIFAQICVNSTQISLEKDYGVC